MYESPEKIALALYYGSKVTEQTGKFVFKPFPTYQHILHEVFGFALMFNFLGVYEYRKGEYMPYSEPVEVGIRDNFIYNPIFDHYEARNPIPLEFNNWLESNKQFAAELKDIRNRYEKYNAKQLYLIMYKNEKDYIKNIRKDGSDVNKYRTEISRTLGSMRYDLIEGSKITEEKYNELREKFESIIN